jgi:hypothetical protein
MKKTATEHFRLDLFDRQDLHQNPWERLYIQFGADPELAKENNTVQNFRKDVLRELKKLKTCWPALDFATPKGHRTANDLR